MTTKIKILPDHLINQIAAGEVVEDAASVVKELVENALDASAQRITVAIENGGYQLLRVVDDGCGMSSDDAVLCFERHATSKIRLADDLAQISTMGFRGEALAALAAVSKVTLTTAHDQRADRGTQVEIAGGRLMAVKPCGRSRGTTIEVRSLFYNVAARRKFQPSPSTSERAIIRLMTAFSLGYPHVEFVVSCEEGQVIYAQRNEQTWFSAVANRVQNLLGEELFVTQRPVQAQKGEYLLRGFLGHVHHHRPQRSGQYLFVAGRYVFSPFLSRSVREAFSTRLPEGRHPLFVLHLQLPAGEVDVNVHPQKKEVRFRDEEFLNRFVREAVQEALLQREYTAASSHTLVQTPGSLSFAESRSPQGGSLAALLPWEMQEGPLPLPSAAVQESNQMELPHISYDLAVIGLFDKYLLVAAQSLSISCPLFMEKKREGMVLIDLALAKARVAFEEMMAQEISTRTSMQRLLIPRKIHLPKPEAARLQKRLSDLQQIGIEIQSIGTTEFLIEGMPRFWEIENVEEVLLASLEEMEKETIAKDLLHRLALRASSFVRWKNSPESIQDAKTLIEKLLTMKDPYYSPRGKPIMALLGERDLELLFLKK